ncbi:unnamed protein product [Ixodes hexagonus]
MNAPFRHLANTTEEHTSETGVTGVTIGNAKRWRHVDEVGPRDRKVDG